MLVDRFMTTICESVSLLYNKTEQSRYRYEYNQINHPTCNLTFTEIILILAYKTIT